MYITHNFYENSMSWANSYVQVWQTIEEALGEMYDTIKKSISHCEPETASKIVQLLKDRLSWEAQTEKDIVDWFVIRTNGRSYEIEDKYWEDVYRFAILDPSKDKYSQF